MSPPDAAPPARRAAPRRLPEGGLLLVVFVLGLALTFLGGSVRTPRFELAPDGQRQRAFTTNSDGERVPAFEEKNKFLNAQNLAQLAKDTSFIAIMAAGATFIIISGGIDLSVGAIYALASVLGAMVLHASTRPLTEATDLANISFSAASKATSTMRSTPLAPITHGTPTYMSLMPNWPDRWAAQGNTRFLSLR